MKDAKPIWQVNECPSWCTTRHSDMDGLDARECISDHRVVGLTTEETLISGRYPDTRAFLDEAHLALEQDYRESSPRITLYRSNGIGFGMTLSEAADLADHIRALLADAGR